MVKKILRLPFVKYILVGLLSLGVDYLLLLFMFRVMDMPLAVASTISFLSGLVVNFLLNRAWSFNAEKGARKAAWQAMLYGFLVCFNLLFTNVLIVYLHTESIGPEISKPLSTALITLWNFVLYRYIIFRTPRVLGEDEREL